MHVGVRSAIFIACWSATCGSVGTMDPMFVVFFSIVVGLAARVRQTESDAPEWSNLVYGYTSHRCHVIPDTFSMCKNIGYDKMILPNFLQHETIMDAVNSSRDWQRLIEFNCHNDTRRFLCSLYAPVCVPNETLRKVQPCQELCLTVKKFCSPPMQTFGYKWPDSLDCDKFPQKNVGLCIRGTEGKPPSTWDSRFNHSMDQNFKNCSCKSLFDNGSIIDKYCKARIVLKAKFTQTLTPNNLKIILRLHRKSKILKSSLTDIPFLKSVEIPCDCYQIKRIDIRKGRWLLMGVIVDQKFRLTSLTKWKKNKTDFKQTIRRLKRFESHSCGSKYFRPQKHVSGVNIFGEKMASKRDRPGMA